MENERGGTDKVLERLCITETKCRRDDKLTIPGFVSYVCNNYRQGEGGAGGVAIFIRDNIRAQFLNLSNKG